MIASAGIVTALGGRASHAAVIARGMGKPAACGVEGMKIDQAGREVVFASGAVIHEGDIVTVSGDQGIVLSGRAEFSDPEPDPWLSRFLDWCDERARVPILDERPSELQVVAEPEDLSVVAGRVLIDVLWEGPDSAALLERMCGAVFQAATPPGEVFISMPGNLAGIDFRPSHGPWAGILARGDNTWAARLLSARLTVGSSTVELTVESSDD